MQSSHQKQAARATALMLWTTSLMSSLLMLDANIMAVSLPAIGRALRASFTDMQWVISAYLLNKLLANRCIDRSRKGKGKFMLAYVFWHWRQIQTAAKEYEGRQRAFHAALAVAPSSGFLRSFSVGLAGAPWAAEGGEAYEDWYCVQDFGALGALNEAAVSASRAAPHAAAATVAGGGAGGIYRLRSGAVLYTPTYAYWFGKPEGMSYSELFAQLTPMVDQVQAALWMRQMVLGPAREFCMQAVRPVSLPAWCDALVIPLRPAWPELAH